jgi:predicted P-loop ATPase
MERMTRKDDKTLKALITDEVDVYRTPYARKAVRRVRRTSVCGTVNPDAFLVDETGNRRYWVVKIKNINLAALQAMSEQEKLQLWAQAYSLYLQNPQGFRLTPEERGELDRRNSAHMSVLAGELEIMEQLDFDAPIDTWQWVRPAQIQVQGNASPKQIGCAIAKIARMYGGNNVQKMHTKKGNAWRLPLKYAV